MATKVFYTLNTANASWGQLQDGGSAPAAAASAYGWANAKVAAGYWRARVGAAATANVTNTTTSYLTAASLLQGTGTTNTTAGNAFRSPTTLTGSFANTTWGFSFGVRTGAASHAGRIRIQVWRGANADGTDATKIGGVGIGSIATLAATATTYTTSGTVAAPGVITLNNEYLFFEVEWQGTTAGTSNSCTTLFYQGVCTITTPDFTPGNQTITQGATYDNPESLKIPALLASYGLTQGATYDNPETLYAPALAATAPDQALTPATFVNTQNFFLGDPYFFLPVVVSQPTGVTQTLTPSLYTDPDGFFTHTLTATAPAQILTPPLYTDADGFFAHTVAAGTVTLAPVSRYDDPDGFFGHLLSLQGGPIVVAPNLHTDPDVFFTHAVATGGVTLFPGMYNNLPDTFFGASMTGGIPVDTGLAPGRIHPFLENVGQIYERT